MVVDSQSVLVSSDVFFVEQRLVSLHSRPDLELNTVTERVSRVLDASLIDDPSLILTIMTFPEVNMSSVVIMSAMNIKTLSSEVSQILAFSCKPQGFLVNLRFPVSYNSSDSNSELISSLIGDNLLSISSSTDGLGPVIEDEPLLVVPWRVVLDSKSVLMTTDVLAPEQCSVCAHLRLDLEPNSIPEWISWNMDSLSVDDPSLGWMVSTNPPGDSMVISVLPTMSGQIEVTEILDLLLSVIEGSLILVVLPWSDHSVASFGVVLCTMSSCNCIVSSVGRSNGLGSLIEGPPLVLIPWSMVLDLQEVLIV